jgi:hypothetical protein
MFLHRAPQRPRARGLFLTGLGLTLASTMVTNALAAGTVSDFGKDLDRSTTLHHFQVDKEPYIGQRFDFNCPARTVRDKDSLIHGTNAYPANTPICVAAQHAGVVDAGGGAIQLQLNPGLGEYKGSRRNGVESRDLPGTQLSIMFMSNATRAELDEIQSKWKPRLKWEDKFSQTGLANIRLTGQRFAFDCPSAPANLAGRVVYGTDTYPLHSLVCLSAVHAGQLSKAGGAALIQMEPAIEGSFVGSIRNGIESKNGPKTPRSITFPGSGSGIGAATADNSAASDATSALPAKPDLKGSLKKSSGLLMK